MRLRRIIPLLTMLLAPVLAWGQDGGLDVKQLVLSHLQDHYEWEIVNTGRTEISIPLPIIVRGTDGGWHAFSAARLRHGATYNGFSIAAEGKNAGKVVEADGSRPSLDISLTRNAAAIMLSSALLLLVVMTLARWYRRDNKLPPKGIRGITEAVIEYIMEEVVKPCLGHEHMRYAPYLLTVFFFILINNLIGLIPIFPGGSNVTGNTAVTLVLAVATFIVVNLSGTREYWKEIFWPDVPSWLKVPIPLMPVIEIFGMFTKPFTLMIRLFANILAGHAAILGMMCVIFMTVARGAAINGSMTVISITFGIFMLCLDLLIAFIQAYVFTLLSAVFIGMARVRHENNNH